jgi:DNA-binding response OmpR family regulator
MIRSEDRTLSHLVARNLERRGFDVLEATLPGAEPRPSHDVKAADLVVVDLGIQEPEQWQRAERVRGEMPQVPLVFLGHASPTAPQIERLQPCAYVRKPFAIDGLLAAVLVASTTVRRPH